MLIDYFKNWISTVFFPEITQFIYSFFLRFFFAGEYQPNPECSLHVPTVSSQQPQVYQEVRLRCWRMKCSSPCEWPLMTWTALVAKWRWGSHQIQQEFPINHLNASQLVLIIFDESGLSKEPWSFNVCIKLWYLLDLLVDNDANSMLGYVVHTSRFTVVAFVRHSFLNGACALERQIQIMLPCF